jgi:hypothetical protein
MDHPPNPASSVTKRYVVTGVALLFAALCQLPYLAAMAREPEGQTFTSLLVNPYDQHYYLAAQRSATENLRSNRFTAEPAAPGPVSRLYPLIGHIGAVFKAPATLLYHLPRILSSLALPFLLLVLMRLCFPGNARRALTATVLALFSVGLGTLAPGLFSHPLGGDNVPEATMLQSVTVFPHFAVAYVGLTLALIAIVCALRCDRLGRTVTAGVAAGGLLGLSHSFLLLPVALTLAATTVVVGWRGFRSRRGREPLRRLVVAGAAIFAPALPFLVSLQAEMSRYERLQGRPFPTTPSDTPWTWAAGYVLLLPFGVLGAVALLREVLHKRGTGRASAVDSAAIGVLVLAGATQMTLVFSSVTPFQRRFSEGVVIPLAALAALGATKILRREILVVLPIGCCALIGAARLANKGEYLPDTVWGAFRQIKESDVVLAGDALASVLPAYSRGSAFVARSTETLRYFEKDDLRRSFLADPNSPAVFDQLRAGGVTLVLADSSDGQFDLQNRVLTPECYSHAFRVGTITGYRLQARCAGSSPSPSGG